MRVEQIIAPNGKLWSEMKKKTKKRKTSRTGKAGIVRLRGKDMTALREQAYDRAQGLCEMPGCRKITGWLSGHLAHIKSRGAGGSDVIENVLWSCAACHMASHNANGKPCPKRPRREPGFKGGDPPAVATELQTPIENRNEER